MPTLNDATLKALETWYEPDHKLHNDPLHPAIGLAGEAGELLDLYKKERFKDGVSWWDCKYCGQEGKKHFINTECDPLKSRIFFSHYTPLILDELGDFWYYLRILAYQQGQDLSEWILENERGVSDNIFTLLVNVNYWCAELLVIYEDNTKVDSEVLLAIFNYFQRVLHLLDYTPNQLTELNYDKLKDDDNHGWKTARHVHKSP